MPTKEFVQEMVNYMKDNSQQTLKQNCKELGISVQTYYHLCKRHDISGKIGPKESLINEEASLNIMRKKVKFANARILKRTN